MKNIKFYIRNILKSMLLIYDLIRFKFTGNSPNGKYHLLLNSFYVFGGVLNNFGSFLLRTKKLSFSPSEGILSKFSATDMRSASKFLRKNGYVVLENVLDESQCESFLKMSLDITGINREMDSNQNQVYEGRYNRENPTSNRFEYDSTTLVNQVEVQKILGDESLLSFAQEYLGGAPTIDIVHMWWHAPFRIEADKNAAQWFHFDMERVKWIKFFFYITDVDTNSGPHTFIPKTHRVWGIPSSLRKKGYVRLSDEEVDSNFPTNSWKEFTGKRGTLIVEDTRGLHKGKHCVSGDRLVFQTEYTISNYGAKVTPPKLEIKNASPEFGRALTKYPIVFSMIEVTK